MNNIFEEAKFGDKYLCRNGEIALYIRSGNKHTLYSQGWIECDDSGVYSGMYGAFPEWDIIGKFKEPINEEKLNELAEDLDNPYEYDNKNISDKWWGFQEGYKVGYHKALEQ